MPPDSAFTYGLINIKPLHRGHTIHDGEMCTRASQALSQGIVPMYFIAGRMEFLEELGFPRTGFRATTPATSSYGSRGGVPRPPRDRGPQGKPMPDLELKRVTQEPPDYRQTKAAAGAETCISVTQIVKADTLQSGAFCYRRPRSLEVGARFLRILAPQRPSEARRRIRTQGNQDTLICEPTKRLLETVGNLGKHNKLHAMTFVMMGSGVRIPLAAPAIISVQPGDMGDRLYLRHG